MWIKNKEGIYLERAEIIVPQGAVALFINDGKTGRLKDYQLVKNLITNAGKNSIAAALRGTANKGVITYCGVGTNSVAPVASNTQLGTELARKLIATREQASGAQNASVFTTFFNTSEAVGTIREIGLFGDSATGVANSGTMFTHAATNRVKSSADTLTIEYTVLIG